MTASLMTLLRRPSSPFFEQDSVSTSVMCWYMGVDSLKASKLTAQNTKRVSTMPSSLKTRRRRASSPMFDFFSLSSCCDMCATESGLETIAVHRGPDVSQNTRVARMVSTDWRRGAAGKGASLRWKAYQRTQNSSGWCFSGISRPWVSSAARTKH